jgi:formate hydrogenlyase subunit 4
VAGSLTLWSLALLQVLVFIAGAPLLTGWIRRVRSALQNRAAPPIWQPYRELAKLFRKNVVLADEASWIFRTTPYVVLAATVSAAAALPAVATHLPTDAIADVIVLVGFLALARFFLALAAMDVGTAFGGMAASREMMVASLAEPAMLIAVFTLSMTAGSTNLSTAVGYILHSGLVLRPAFVFTLVGLLMVAIAETGRLPVDNPATHLELTMIHEGMILEYGGRHLALIEWASEIKLMIYGVLIADLFLPWGIATRLTVPSLLLGSIALVAKLAFWGGLLAMVETHFAKMRLFRVPEFLNIAFLLCLLGLLSHLILEVAL